MIVNGRETMVRYWQPADMQALRPMILDCLDTNHQAGADMLATEKNADALLLLGLAAADRGEPCLVVELCPGLASASIMGYTLWCEMPNPLGLDFQGRVLHGLGTYVMPQYRNEGVSRHLRNCAEGLASRQGFTKVVGCAYHEAGVRSVLGRGYKPAGLLVEKGL